MSLVIVASSRREFWTGLVGAPHEESPGFLVKEEHSAIPNLWFHVA